MSSTRLVQTLSSEEIVITRNEIFAQRCKDAYFRNAIQAEYTISNQPYILSLIDWIKYCWEQSQPYSNILSKKLLTPLQSVNLWQNIIHNTQPSSSTITHLAYDAWQTCQNWHIDIKHSAFQNYRETRQFQHWANLFIQQCYSKNQVDLHHAILELIQSNAFQLIELPKQIRLLGFDHPTPHEQQLFSHLLKQGYSLKPLVLPFSHATSCTINTIAFEEVNTELETMAHWALQNLKAHPNTPIVCVIPDFKAQRTNIISKFQSVYRDFSRQPTPYDYPLNIPFETKTLTQHPLIQTALDIIYLRPPFSLVLLTRLLRSSYVNHAESERFARIQLDRFLRNQKNLIISPDKLTQWSENFQCLYLRQTIQNLQRQYSDKNDRKKPSQWVTAWQLMLHTWGWPGTQPLLEEEKYHYNQWLNALKAFTDLDSIISSISDTEALDSFVDHIHNTEVPFQLHCSNTEIQLIDSTDIINSGYATYWLFNSNESDLSQTKSSNPFIPPALQKTLERTNTASSILQKILPQANHVICSHAQTSLTITHPSKNTIKEMNASDLNLIPYSTISEQMMLASTWESFIDDHAPSISDNLSILSKGVDLIKKQAICPFRAFSDYRLSLKSHSLTFPTDIPDYAEKAICLHHILKTLWSQLKEQSVLQQLSEPDLKDLLLSIIHQEMQHFIKKRPNSWKPVFTANEKERLYQLLHKWLLIEKQRPPFVVKAVEYETTLTLGPLKLSLIIDRIDQLSDGSLLLIDYKTSLHAPTFKSWSSNRPTEPQLPLYALSMDQTIQAIAWVHLHPEYGGKFLGVNAYDIGISGLYTPEKQTSSLNWKDLLQAWETSLNRLAHQFYEGYAAVDPKEGNVSCQHCPYTLLCRVTQPDG